MPNSSGCIQAAAEAAEKRVQDQFDLACLLQCYLCSGRFRTIRIKTCRNNTVSEDGINQLRIVIVEETTLMKSRDSGRLEHLTFHLFGEHWNAVAPILLDCGSLADPPPKKKPKNARASRGVKGPVKVGKKVVDQP